MELYEKNYELVFEEDFSGGLDQNKWVALDETVKAHYSKPKNTDFIPSHVVTMAAAKHEGSNMHYDPKNVAVKDGALVITAGRDDEGFNGGKAVCNGLVFAHGYVEVEAELPDFQKGVWPVFSLVSTEGTAYKADFDVIAVHGDKGQNATNMYIRWIDEIYETPHKIGCLFGRPKRFYPEAAGEKLAPGVHKFGIEITSDFVTFYVDGNEVSRRDVTPSTYQVLGRRNFLKFTAGLSIGLPNIDAPEDDADFPTEFKIKNIKLYQNEGDLLVKR